MSSELIGFIAIFLGMIGLFLTEVIPIDLTACLALMMFTITGYVTPHEAFSGFSSEAIILMVASFFVSGALRLTGMGDRLAHHLVHISGKSEARCVALVVFVGATISSVMNNVAAVAVLLPAVGGIAKRTGVSPSRLFMPLSFGVLLGGTTTLIGTSSNLLASEVLKQQNMEPLGFLEFFPIGASLVLLGGLFMVMIGRKFLPGKTSDGDAVTADLPSLYRLKERMFTLHIPENSLLSGKTLESIHFQEVLGADVMAINRRNHTTINPGAKDTLVGGDTLFVRGRIEELQSLFRLHGSLVEPVASGQKRGISIPLRGINICVDKTFMQKGRTIKEIGFRKSTGLHVIAIERNGSLIYNDVPHVKLQENDILRTIGAIKSGQNLVQSANYQIVKTVEVDAMSTEAVFLLHVPQESTLSDLKIRDSRLHELVGLTVIGIIQGKESTLGVSGDAVIHSGDTLVVAGRASVAEHLAALSTLKIMPYEGSFPLENDEIGMMEVVLSPRSKLIGKNLEDVNFTDRYGFRVIAIWRDGEPKRTKFSKVPLVFGDALLLQGPRDRMHLFAKDPDFVLLTTEYQTPVRTTKDRWAICSLFLLAFLSIFNIQPPHVAAVIAALVAILGGAIRMEEGYREIEWRVVILVACLLPIGNVVQHLGIPEAVSGEIAAHASFLGEAGILAFLVITSSFFSQALDSSITVISLAPIAVSLSRTLDLPPHPFVMAVAFGASIAFMTPFSHRAHLLIMGPGSYRAKDFFRIGFFLSILCFLIVILVTLMGTGKW